MRVLLVEDELDLAAAIVDGLEAEGYAVDVAHDGVDGLWRAREGDYAAIVLDLLLPGLNGYLVCRRLREEGDWTPVLVLTAKDGEEDEAEALDTGADDYLVKPFSFTVLLARLRALQRRGRRERPAVLTAGDLRLDPATRRCARGDVPITLTRREHMLLDVLLRRAGEVVPRDELLARVWGMDFDGNPAILDVYVGYLRAKIDRPFGTASLETVRGAGYRIADG